MPFFTHSGFNELAENISPDERFDLVSAIQHAKQINADGVQLYFNNKLLDEEYLAKLMKVIKNEGFRDYIIHLPNYDHPEFNKFVALADSITTSLAPDINITTLVHYGYNSDQDLLNTNTVPVVGDQKIFIENSKTGEFDRQHVLDAIQLVRDCGSGLVLDLGRFAFPPVASDNFYEQEYKEFVEEVINMFTNPTELIIHTSGTSDAYNYRDAEVAHGDPNDIFRPIYPYIIAHHRRGGIVVVEAPKPENVEESIRFLREFTSANSLVSPD